MRRDLLERVGEPLRVRLAGVVGPVVVEAVEDRRAARRQRGGGVAGVERRVERARVDRALERDRLAAGDELVGRGPERAPQLGQRGAQAGAGRLVEHVGPEARGELGAGVRAGVQREVGEHGAGAAGGRRRELVAVRAEREPSGESDLQHDANCRARREPVQGVHATFTVRERYANGRRGSIAAMSRDLRLLAGAAGLSALGDFMAVFPLILHVQQSTGSAFAVSALVFALWGPVVLAAGLAGAIVDRFENRGVLIVVSFAQAAVVAGMVAGADELWALLPLMALLGFGVAVSQPAEFALVPAAAGGGDVARANGLMETVRSLGFTAGPLVGGALGAAGLLRLALALNALSFVVVGVTALAAAGPAAAGAGRTTSRCAPATASPSSSTSATSRSRSAARSPRSRSSRSPSPPSRSSSPRCSTAARSPTACC